MAVKEPKKAFGEDLVVDGESMVYDEIKRETITKDAGTKKGERVNNKEPEELNKDSKVK